MTYICGHNHHDSFTHQKHNTMREIKKIANDTTRYPMAMHIDMQEQIYGLIQPFAPEKILLGTTDIPSWK